jgi:hypothetical protein
MLSSKVQFGAVLRLDRFKEVSGAKKPEKFEIDPISNAKQIANIVGKSPSWTGPRHSGFLPHAAVFAVDIIHDSNENVYAVYDSVEGGQHGKEMEKLHNTSPELPWNLLAFPSKDWLSRVTEADLERFNCLQKKLEETFFKHAIPVEAEYESDESGNNWVTALNIISEG